MDRRATLDRLKRKVRTFCDDRGWDRTHNAKDLAIGVITEASELLEHFRFKTREESERLLSRPVARRKICDELADVLHTLLRFSQIYGIDLSDELARKMKRNAKKYPLPAGKGKAGKKRS